MHKCKTKLGSTCNGKIKIKMKSMNTAKLSVMKSFTLEQIKKYKYCYEASPFQKSYYIL